MREIKFEIPGRTPMLNEWMRWHWTKQRQYTKDIAWMVRKAIGTKKRDPFKHCLIFVERYSHGNQRMDWDNLLAGCKFLFDSLTVRHPSGVGLIEDDNTDCILVMPTIIPISVSKKEPERTIVKILEMPHIKNDVNDLE